MVGIPGMAPTKRPSPAKASAARFADWPRGLALHARFRVCPPHHRSTRIRSQSSRLCLSLPTETALAWLKSGQAVAYVIPCVRFNCLVRRFRASVTIATLGTIDWLGLVRQRLSLCKKRQALLGAPTLGISGTEAAKPPRERERRESAKLGLPAGPPPLRRMATGAHWGSRICVSTAQRGTRHGGGRFNFLRTLLSRYAPG